MELVTAKFPSIAELVDFQIVTDQRRATIDPASCTLTGRLSEAELELAVNGYQAQPLHHSREHAHGLRFSRFD